MPRILILGAGFTGLRVARALLAAGHEVHASARDPSRLLLPGARLHRVDAEDPASLAALAALDGPLRVLHSVPSGPRGDPTPALLAPLAGKLEHAVYLSTTGVYGAARDVDETTPIAPETDRQRDRAAAERAVAAAAPALILRPAAIYGPGRGVHVSMRQGRYRLAGDGSNVVSRIHVDDLAALAAAALLSDVTGAYPVADDEPAPAAEVAAFCAQLLGVPLPPSVPPESLDETLRVTRRVDGRAIRRLLGVALRYPSFRSGIPAAIAEEKS